MKRNYFLSTALGLLLSAGVFAQSDFPCESLDPTIESTEINICIPGGVLTLEAKTNTGNEILWYDSIGAKEPIGTGTSFEVDASSNDPYTISYWITEGRKEDKIINKQGKVKYDNAAPLSTQPTKGLLINSFESFKIISVDVFSTDFGGEVSVQLFEHDPVRQTDRNIADIKVNIPEGSEIKPTPYTIPLNFDVPSEGMYKLALIGNVPLVRERLSQDDYPFPLGSAAEIKEGTHVGASMGPPSKDWNYYWFYNWTIEANVVICESEPRKEIKVNINDDYPEVPTIDSEFILCGEANFTLEDIIVEANDAQWYNENFDELEGDTLIEEGITYLLTDTSVGGCESGFAEVSFTILEVSTTPIAEIEQSFEEGSGETLASLEVEGENLQWYAGADKEEKLSEDTELVDATTYYVTQTLEDHCESEPLGITVAETLGVNDVVFEGLKYTNPVKDILYLTNSENIDEVVLYDLTGKELSFDLSDSSSTKVNLSHLRPGTYILNLKVKDNNMTIRIIKK